MYVCLCSKVFIATEYFLLIFSFGAVIIFKKNGIGMGI